MKPERIQHLNDVIFTRETIKCKDMVLPVTHTEVKELLQAYERYPKLKQAFLTLLDSTVEAAEGFKVKPEVIEQIKKFHMDNAGLLPEDLNDK